MASRFRPFQLRSRLSSSSISTISHRQHVRTASTAASAAQSTPQTSSLPPDVQKAIRREAALPTPDPPKDSQTNTLLNRQIPYMVPTYVRPPTMFAKGLGCYLYDVENREYLDLTAGVAVNALGHCDPEVTNIIARQSATLLHSSNLYHNPWTPLLSETLVQKTRESAARHANEGGFPTASRAFICNSGTEANEAALKFARKYAKHHTSNHHIHNQNKFVSFNGAFHGRTMFALSATPNPKYQAPFSPMVPGFTHISLNDTSVALSHITPETCGVIVEPIQGEGGVNPASIPFLQALRQKCTEVNALLIYDEIQAGMGRTGSLWACDAPGIPPPDILTTAKALGNGFPIGAALVSEAVANAISVGDHGTTFGGNPVACRVACHVLDRITHPSFLTHVTQRGEQFRAHFARLRSRWPDKIREIRGRGLLLGVQLSADAEIAAVITAARERGLLIISCGTDTLRIVPPLVVEEADVERGMQVLERAMESVWVEKDAALERGTVGQQEME